MRQSKTVYNSLLDNDNKPNKHFGEWLRRKRQEAGLTQKQAAVAAEVQLNTWSRLELGASTKRSTIIRVAGAVGADAMEALREAGFASAEDSAWLNGTAPFVLNGANPVALVDVAEVVRQAKDAQNREDYEEAEKLWRQAIAAEPEQEVYSRALMQMLYDQGEKEPNKLQSAIQVYNDLRVVLGRLPDLEIRRLFRRIRHMRDDASGDFVGRGANKEQIAEEFKLNEYAEGLNEHIATEFSKTRLMTLWGREGVGKTELARAVADDLKQDYRDGVCFVPLGTFLKSRPDLDVLSKQDRMAQEQECVAQALLFALKAPRSEGQSFTESVIAALETSIRLIVLDGCTSLRHGCARLVQKLLRNCLHIRILATCRSEEGLELGETQETLFHVLPLEVPSQNEILSVNKMTTYTAPLLFQQRANRIKTESFRMEGFKIDENNKELVANICRKTEGLTTYIAWAASLLRSKELADIEAEMPDLPTPHNWRTWLTHSLASPEKQLLRRLTVFPNGWTRDSAQQVCSDESLSEWQIASSLEDLDAFGLIHREGRNDSDRGWVWEPLYEDIRNEMKPPDAEDLRKNMLDWCLTIAQKDGDIYHQIKGVERRYDLLEKEMDNIRASLAWSLAGPVEEAVKGLRLASLIWGFWNVRGYWSEGRYWLEKALTATKSCPESKERLDALNGAGVLAVRQRDYANAEDRLEMALACDYPDRTPDLKAAVLNSLGYLYMSWGKLDQAREYYESARACYQQITGDKATRREWKWPLSGLGDVEMGYYRQDRSAKHLEKAQQYYEESLQIAEDFSDKDGVAQAQRHLAAISQERGNLDEAERYLTQSLTALNELENRAETISVIEQLAAVVKLRGTKEKGEKALRLYEKAVRLYAGAESLRQKYGVSNESEEDNRKTLAENRKDFISLLNGVEYDKQRLAGLGKSSQEIIYDAISEIPC